MDRTGRTGSPTLRPLAKDDPLGQMKPVSLEAKLAAAETELACVKMVLAHVKLDRDELRQERDDWRREAETLGAQKLETLGAQKLIAEKLKEADERRCASQPVPSRSGNGGIGYSEH
jgi:hypothetical protein